MKLEHHTQPVLTRTQWVGRIARCFRVAGLLVLISLSIGILGYHFLGHLPWIDALLESAMILGGEGPIAPMNNDTVKIFASLYALFSGLMLVTITGLLLGPWLHRVMHQLMVAEK
jgi:hypothetical protein